jgi:signal transduction histidine kinase
VSIYLPTTNPSATMASRSRRMPLNPLRMLFSAEPWLSLVFMLLSFVLGVFWFVVLVTLIATGGGLLVTLVGVPILAGTMYLWIGGAKVERHRVNGLLGTEIRDPYAPVPEGSIFQKIWARMKDGHTWLDLLYLFLLFPIGIAEFVIATVVVSIPFSLMATPFFYWFGDADWVFPAEFWNIDSTPEALVVGVAGVAVLMLMPYILAGIGRGHAWLAKALLGTNREAELEQRVETLTDTRSRAVDISLSERRRIERDLHDGAQQQLVKLAMDLGMAREKIESDPEAAKALVAEAHEEAKTALTEIRNLVRGIHPAVLTDRGLDPAISALAGRSPVPVQVDVQLPERPPEAVESAAYFVVAEALTNVARHSQATEARVRVAREGMYLIVEVSDNGVGGADAGRGTGLAGLADRVNAFDGRLSVTSPAGGPTSVRAELPYS